MSYITVVYNVLISLYPGYVDPNIKREMSKTEIMVQYLDQDEWFDAGGQRLG
jgi:hypothetical protein